MWHTVHMFVHTTGVYRDAPAHWYQFEISSELNWHPWTGLAGLNIGYVQYHSRRRTLGKSKRNKKVNVGATCAAKSTLFPTMLNCLYLIYKKCFFCVIG